MAGISNNNVVSSPSRPPAAGARNEDVFLFVNPKSGGNRGQDFLSVPQPFVTELDDGRTATLHIYSLFDKPEEGFEKLKKIYEKTGTAIRTIVGGGDGTVMFVDSVATKCGVDTSKQCIYGIVPLGTGNDFSRVAGWGGKNPKRILLHDCQKLHVMVKLWCNARPRPHDVWEVHAEVDEGEGKILQVSKEKKEVEMEGKAKTFTFPMINYFSIGQESKVGVEFDKRRTKSQSCNLVMYACSGIFTECDCDNQQRVGDIVSSLHVGTDPSGPAIFEYVDEEEDEHDEAPKLVGNPESLMFLNVNSYAGGAAHFWQLDSELAVDPEPPRKEVEVEADPGDGRLEVITLPSIVGIALDSVKCEARRVWSGGPYYMEFFQPMDHVDNLDAFCEVDGEFYHLVNPLSVAVRYKKKLQVLQNEDPNSKNILKMLVDKGHEVIHDGVHTIEGKIDEKMKKKRSSSKKR